MQLETVLQAILLTAERPLGMDQLLTYFTPEEQVTRTAIHAALQALSAHCAGQSFELTETASGFRLQTRMAFQPWVQRHHEEKPAKYSRALLETLALVVWRQPITRAEIEAVRGVAVNASILRTLMERNWVRVIGHKEVPGRPELLGTTREFLDYFNLRSLDDLPGLPDIQHLDVDELKLDGS